jgi:hypothetical protein
MRIVLTCSVFVTLVEVCNTSLADLLPLVLEPPTGLGSKLFKISPFAGRDLDRRRREVYDEGKKPYQGYRWPGRGELLGHVSGSSLALPRIERFYSIWITSLVRHREDGVVRVVDEKFQCALSR